CVDSFPELARPRAPPQSAGRGVNGKERRVLMIDKDKAAAFRAAFRGEVIEKGAPLYDEARALYNGMIDKKPLMIARVADIADVIAAVKFARGSGLVVAVRGGGHSGPGFGSCDDGLVIDLSRLKGVRVDPKAKTIRVEPGCTQADVDHAGQAF